MDMYLFFKAVAVGITATLTMDAGGLLGFKLGLAGRGPRRQGPEFIGRWAGYLVRGRIRHADILLTPPLTGEITLGLVTHYATGIGLALVYVALLRATGTVPYLLPALAYGIVTVIFAWFLYFPAIGAGWMGRAASPGMHMARSSFLAHAIYGLGLAAGTMLFLSP